MVRERLAPQPGTGVTGASPHRPHAGSRYHHGGPPTKRDRRTDQSTRKFVAWDGEGVNLRGPGKPQSYVLFGSSEGHIANREGLSTWDCLDYIIDTGRRHPGAVHVGFAFSYDANMIIQSLSPVSLAKLHHQGWVRLTRGSGERYTLTFAKGKYFRVTKYLPSYHAKSNKTAKVSVQIFDIFSFFMCSFIKAYEQMIGPIPDVITKGKAGRQQFTIDAFDEIVTYWTLEIQLLRELADELRKRVFNAGLRISQWHGPGALASYAMRERGIKKHMGESSAAIREAARYAYAGGRFELFKLGRIAGPVYGVDINSAYPYAIAQLPSFNDGWWEHVETPTKISRFGVYRVRVRDGRPFDKRPGAFFHRDKQHNISFPWMVDGWYWSPEVVQACESGRVEILEGWVFRHGHERPFSWIGEMYAQRREWKLRGISAQMALKLCMNSMYGKLAQRIGWDEEKQRIPPFHQLEWAGWITSYTRAKLYEVMRRIPYDKLVAVETDGIYTTMPPSELGIVDSVELGGWEVSEYAEILYVQSGLAWLRDDDNNWSDKRRGLDPCRAGHAPTDCYCKGVFSLNACRDYLESLHPRPSGDFQWQPYVGETTRFVGVGQALASIHTQERHCVWETVPREINPGNGKRMHAYMACQACADGANALDSAHDLVIRSRSLLEPQSYQHSIPWEKEDGHAEWRDHQDDDGIPFI